MGVRVVLLGALAATGLARAAEPERLLARTVENEGVTVAFPAVTYYPPVVGADGVTAACARAASTALGTTVDPQRDLVAETTHRVLFRDPTRPTTHLLKLYRPDHYKPEQAAKLIQRDLGLGAFLQGLGLRVATIDPDARLIERGVERQQRIVGTGLDERYPTGYPAGADPQVDRMLARIKTVDRALIGITSRQSGYLFSNTADCVHDEPLGVDVGHCLGNIMLEQGSGAPILVDW